MFAHVFFTGAQENMISQDDALPASISPVSVKGSRVFALADVFIRHALDDGHAVFGDTQFLAHFFIIAA